MTSALPHDVVFATVNFLGKRPDCGTRANRLAELLKEKKHGARRWFIVIEEARDLERNALWDLAGECTALPTACIQIFTEGPVEILCEKRYGAVVKWEGIHIAVVHLKSTPANSEEREKQLQSILSENPDLIIGDFNYHDNTEGVIPGFVDVWTAEHKITENPGWTYDYRSNRICEYTVRKRIDRIYVSNTKYHGGGCVTLSNALLISDHYPLMWQALPPVSSAAQHKTDLA